MGKKNRVIRILRIIMPIVAITIAIVVAPLDLLPPWIAPLPDTVKEQVDSAINYGLDGLSFMSINQAKHHNFIVPAGKIKRLKSQPIPTPCSKLAVSTNCISPQRLPNW